MLYTTYLANISNLDDDMRKILVTRWKPRKGIDIDKYNLEWKPELAPSDILLSKYKNAAMTKQEMFEEYKSNLENKLPSLRIVESIVEDIESGKDVVLICYEKDVFDCHRSVLADYISKKYNIEYKEF